MVFPRVFFFVIHSMWLGLCAKFSHYNTMFSWVLVDFDGDKLSFSEGTIKKSKGMRKKMKKGIINGDPTFDKLNEDNDKLVTQLEIDVSDLERKLKELNAMLCGDKCGGCTNTGCDSCGTLFSDCKGVKQMATDALNKAKEAKKLLEQKKGNSLLNIVQFKCFFLNKEEIILRYRTCE